MPKQAQRSPITGTLAPSLDPVDPLLSLFSPYAEQRASLGEEAFLRTHAPTTLWDDTVPVPEEILLRQVLDVAPHSPGNRIWIVDGPLGTGKSEVLQWLSLRVARDAPHRGLAMLHISQAEADPLRIAEQLRQLHPGDFRPLEMGHRWREMSEKPRTVAKILLLQALDQLVRSDDEGYHLYYSLADQVEVHLRGIIEACRGEIERDEPPELMSYEAWEEFRLTTSVPVPFDYSAFHQALRTAFHSYLLSSLSLPALMQDVSDAFASRGGPRPILLIDDLVGSLHLFAPDLMNAMVLSQGTWDVVVGVTTGAAGTGDRIARLLARLLESAGVQAYYRLASLDEDHAVDLAGRYIAEGRRSGKIAGEGLFPFNRPSLVRILRGLPPGKQTSRAFLRHLHILLPLEGDALLSRMMNFASCEYAVQSSDTRLAMIGELYGPLLVNHAVRVIRLEPQAAFDQPAAPAELAIVPFSQYPNERLREEVALLHSWARGCGLVETADLTLLRKGAARLLRDTLAPEILGVPQGRLRGLLHLHQVMKGFHPPVLFAGEKLPRGGGIVLSRVPSDLLFDLALYATVHGSERHSLASYLRDEPRLASFFQSAHRYRVEAQARLEKQLAIPLDSLALLLNVWATRLNAGISSPQSPDPAGTLTWSPLPDTPAWRQERLTRERLVREWRQFFQDVYTDLAGDYDNARIEGAREVFHPQDAGNIFEGDPSLIGSEFRWGNQLLRDAISEWQQWIRLSLPDEGSPIL